MNQKLFVFISILFAVYASGQTVSSAISQRGCTTSVVAKLSQQLVRVTNCIAPNSFSDLREMSNVRLSSAARAVPFLQTSALNSLRRALGGNRITVNSALRTLPQQLMLYRWQGSCGISVAARPGRSNHNGGLALDTPEYSKYRSALERNGFKWYGSRDRVHFDFRGAGGKDIRNLSVRAFQMLYNANNANKITVDGAYGPQTERALLSAPINGYAKMPSQCGGQVPTTTTTRARTTSTRRTAVQNTPTPLPEFELVYERATRCTSETKGMRAVVDSLLPRFSGIRNGGIYNCRRVGGSGSLSEHAEGRAWDAMLTPGNPQGQRLADFLVDNARNLGVQAVIYNRKVWGYGRYHWRQYSGSHPHTDHVHVGLNRKAAAQLTKQQVDAVYAASTTGTGSVETPPQQQQNCVRVAVSVANIRSGPSTSYRVVTQSRRGQSFVVSESRVISGRRWLRITPGWIASWITEPTVCAASARKGDAIVEPVVTHDDENRTKTIMLIVIPVNVAVLMVVLYFILRCVYRNQQHKNSAMQRVSSFSTLEEPLLSSSWSDISFSPSSSLSSIPSLVVKQSPTPPRRLKPLPIPMDRKLKRQSSSYLNLSRRSGPLVRSTGLMETSSRRLPQLTRSEKVQIPK